jgi:hypothetical protein
MRIFATFVYYFLPILKSSFVTITTFAIIGDYDVAKVASIHTKGLANFGYK